MPKIRVFPLSSIAYGNLDKRQKQAASLPTVMENVPASDATLPDKDMVQHFDLEEDYNDDMASVAGSEISNT